MTSSMKPTYFSFLVAGLGNRLFQHAAVKGLAARDNADYNVIGQESVGSHHNSSYPWLMSRIAPTPQFPNATQSLIQHAATQENIKVYNQPYDQHLGFYDIESTNCHTVFLGFFQSERYFDNIRQELRVALSEPSVEVARDLRDYQRNLKAQFSDMVAIHVRLGDFVNCGKHFVDLQAYYERCISALRRQYKHQRINFMIVCEDVHNIELVYPRLLPFIIDGGDNLYMCNHPNRSEEFDLYLMTLCGKGVICSNSTFAWWGAWLNNSIDKKIYIPGKWLRDRNDIIGMKGAEIVSTTIA